VTTKKRNQGWLRRLFGSGSEENAVGAHDGGRQKNDDALEVNVDQWFEAFDDDDTVRVWQGKFHVGDRMAGQIRLMEMSLPMQILDDFGAGRFTLERRRGWKVIGSRVRLNVGHPGEIMDAEHKRRAAKDTGIAEPGMSSVYPPSGAAITVHDLMEAQRQGAERHDRLLEVVLGKQGGQDPAAGLALQLQMFKQMKSLFESTTDGDDDGQGDVLEEILADAGKTVIERLKGGAAQPEFAPNLAGVGSAAARSMGAEAPGPVVAEGANIRPSVRSGLAQVANTVPGQGWLYMVDLAVKTRDPAQLAGAVLTGHDNVMAALAPDDEIPELFREFRSDPAGVLSDMFEARGVPTEMRAPASQIVVGAVEAALAHERAEAAEEPDDDDEDPDDGPEEVVDVDDDADGDTGEED